MVSRKEELQTLIKRIDHVLADGTIGAHEFREFEILILESLRTILRILQEQKRASPGSSPREGA
jgi:hypothetical protein